LGNELSEDEIIRVAILDDHQSIIDGYRYRLTNTPDVEVVAAAAYADELEPLLARNKPHVLIVDVFVQTSQENPTPFPIMHAIPNWLQRYPQMSILVISMYNLRTLVRAVVEAGASGYILKDDHATIQELGSVIRTVARGGIHFSQQAHQHILNHIEEESVLTRRQLQVLSLCVAHPNAGTAELADMLGVAHSTLRNLLSGAYLKLNVHNRSAAVAKASKLGLIPLQEPPLEI